MKSKLINVLASLFLCTYATVIFAKPYTMDVIDIWPGKQIPFNKENIQVLEKLDEENKRFSQISKPQIFLFRNKQANSPGPALLYIPGGGYARVSTGRSRGAGWAKLFFELGFTTVAVLKYRLPDDRIVEQQHKVPLVDAQQALALLHRNAKLWNIDRSKIGLKGSSAGGHLAASLNNLREEDIVDGISKDELVQAFSILRVPVITFTEPYRHNGSYRRLLGSKKNDKSLIQKYSMESQVSSLTPPTFLVYATDDTSVPYQNSEMYIQALAKNEVPYKAVRLEKGGHGFGMNREKVDKDWLPELKQWVESVVASD